MSNYLTWESNLKRMKTGTTTNCKDYNDSLFTIQKKTKYCLSNLRKAVFSDGIWDFFSKKWSFLGFGWFGAILDEPNCAMSVQNGACACDGAFLFFIYFFYFWWLLLTGGDWLRGSVKRFEIPLLTLAPPGGVEVRYSKLGWSEMGWIMLHYVRAQTASFWRSTFLGKI